MFRPVEIPGAQFIAEVLLSYIERLFLSIVLAQLRGVLQVTVCAFDSLLVSDTFDRVIQLGNLFGLLRSCRDIRWSEPRDIVFDDRLLFPPGRLASAS